MTNETVFFYTIHTIQKPKYVSQVVIKLTEYFNQYLKGE